MEKIQMVDVVSMYNRHSKEIDRKIKYLINKGSFIQGNEVIGFEENLSKFLKSKHTISCGNGTDALYIALMALDLKPGDEVIVPSFTFISTVEAVCLLGLKPVFVDINPNTFLIDVEMIENSITEKVKAVIPVHLFGQCCDMVEILRISKQYNIYVIEDAAQSIGSSCVINDKLNRKFSGTIGHIGTTSFYPSKNLGAFGDGGAIFTQNKALAKKIKLISNHGQNKKYSHQIVVLNSRLDSIQAGILNCKLKYLVSDNNKRFNVAKKYNELLSDLDWITLPKKTEKSDHIFHQYSILLSEKVNRTRFQKYLSRNKVPTMIYYPIPAHKQNAYKKFAIKKLSVSESISKNIISLPIHPVLKNSQVKYICDLIRNFK